MIENVSDGRSNGRILGQELIDQIGCFAAEICRYDKFAGLYADQRVLDRRAFKRRLPSHHGIHNAAQTP